MSKLCTLSEIIEKIKDYLCRQDSCKYKKVFDADVAGVLRISHFNLATMKKRNKIPYKQIMLHCDRCGLDPRDIFFKKEIELLESIENQ